MAEAVDLDRCLAVALEAAVEAGKVREAGAGQGSPAAARARSCELRTEHASAC